MRATLKGGENFFHPPPAEIFGIYPPLPRVSPWGNSTPPKKFLDHYRGVEKFYPPLNGQKIQFIPPKMAKKSVYTPQNESKKFYPTQKFFFEISPPSPGRNFYPPLLATCSHMYGSDQTIYNCTFLILFCQKFRESNVFNTEVRKKLISREIFSVLVFNKNSLKPNFCSTAQNSVEK